MRRSYYLPLLRIKIPIFNNEGKGERLPSSN